MKQYMRTVKKSAGEQCVTELDTAKGCADIFKCMAFCLAHFTFKNDINILKY